LYCHFPVCITIPLFVLLFLFVLPFPYLYCHPERSEGSAFLPATSSQLEILDLRHFSAAHLRPLLNDEAARWHQRLHWDYTRAAATVLDYLNDRVLPGYVALRDGRLLGYAFSVLEASKAVVGDVYALGETGSLTNPVCETLLHHLLELLQNTPGVDRIESQLLMFPEGALAGPYLAAGFRPTPRLYMLADLTHAPTYNLEPTTYNLLPWQPNFYEPAAALIHRSYAAHMDSGLNDQYCTLHGAQRFLHNIIRFPGCGTFDADNSFALLHPKSRALQALILCSRIRGDVAHITQLCVEPALRGQGLGRLLLEHGAGHLARSGVQHITLTVTEANAPALRLYADQGFDTLHRFDAMVWQKTQRQP
jgi:GNAT superfamily N-acetyltransferase